MIALVVSALALADVPPALEAAWADRQPYQVRNEAMRRLELGDYQGARDRLQYLRDRGVLDGQPVYQLGLVSELQEDYEAALELYRTVVDEHSDSAFVNNARFRMALVLEDLGRHDESVAVVEELIALGAWSEEDRLSLELARAVNRLLDTGRKRHRAELAELVAEADQHDDLTWMRAKGNAALVADGLQRADELCLVGNKRAARRLAERSRLMKEAEEHIIGIAHLDEPEYVLDSLVALGDSYLSLYDAMLDSKPPWWFGRDKRRIYRQLVADKAQVLETKAWRFYDQGLQLALRIQWEGAATDTLRARRDAVNLADAGPGWTGKANQ